jgi:hypothetical protein
MLLNKSKVIHPQFLLFRPGFNALYPPVPVLKMVFPPPLGNGKRFHLAPLNLFGYPGV